MQNDFIIANLAQSVEQRIRNAQVAGSIPAVGSTKKAAFKNTTCSRFYLT